MLMARIRDFEEVLSPHSVPVTDHVLMKPSFHSPVVQYATHMAQFYVLQHTGGHCIMVHIDCGLPSVHQTKESRSLGLEACFKLGVRSESDPNYCNPKSLRCLKYNKPPINGIAARCHGVGLGWAVRLRKGCDLETRNQLDQVHVPLNTSIFLRHVLGTSN